MVSRLATRNPPLPATASCPRQPRRRRPNRAQSPPSQDGHAGVPTSSPPANKRRLAPFLIVKTDRKTGQASSTNAHRGRTGAVTWRGASEATASDRTRDNQIHGPSTTRPTDLIQDSPWVRSGSERPSPGPHRVLGARNRAERMRTGRPRDSARPPAHTRLIYRRHAPSRLALEVVSPLVLGAFGDSGQHGCRRVPHAAQRRLPRHKLQRVEARPHVHVGSVREPRQRVRAHAQPLRRTDRLTRGGGFGTGEQGRRAGRGEDKR